MCVRVRASACACASVRLCVCVCGGVHYLGAHIVHTVEDEALKGGGRTLQPRVGERQVVFLLTEHDQIGQILHTLFQRITAEQDRKNMTRLARFRPKEAKEIQFFF